MTIKEMQKLYKKGHKVVGEYFQRKAEIETTVAWGETFEACTKLRKACMSVEKLAMAVDMFAGELIERISQMDEEMFVRWCLINNVDWKQEEEQEETEE